VYRREDAGVDVSDTVLGASVWLLGALGIAIKHVAEVQLACARAAPQTSDSTPSFGTATITADAILRQPVVPLPPP
jgi:hypothetical protein